MQMNEDLQRGCLAVRFQYYYKMHIENSEQNLILYSVWEPFHSLSNVKLLDLWF